MVRVARSIRLGRRSPPETDKSYRAWDRHDNRVRSEPIEKGFRRVGTHLRGVRFFDRDSRWFCGRLGEPSLPFAFSARSSTGRLPAKGDQGLPADGGAIGRHGLPVLYQHPFLVRLSLREA